MASSASLGPFSPAPPSLTHPVMKDDGECVNWVDLPSELTSSILSRLDNIDILENAQKVCTSWRRVCKDPAMWCKIVIDNLGNLGYDLEVMCHHAVDLSQGGLVEIDIGYIGSDSLVNYIANRSSSLRSLKLAMCSLITNKGLTEALGKLPLLEELEVSQCTLSWDTLKVLSQSCPKLKTLMLYFGNGPPRYVSDDDALAIAETMPRLRFLQLFGNFLSDTGVNAILDNCPNLEHLDLRLCFNVKFVGDLETRCLERIKVLRRPEDSFHDYPYDISFYDTDISEDYYAEDPTFVVPSNYSDYDPYDSDDGSYLDGIFS